MTIESRLAEIRARVDAATEGPWSVYRGDRIGTYVTRPDLAGVAREWSLTWSDADAEFIAHSRTDLPALLAAVQAVREKLPSLLEAAWDDGNALGLDGWTGPERGEEPDEHAIRRRARLRSKLVDEACEALTAALDANTPTREDQTHD